MAYFIGIDQGGSKTLAVVGDARGHIVGVGQSYGAVHSVNGMDYAMQACREATLSALGKAGLTLSDISSIVGGISGIDWDYEQNLVVQGLQKSLGFANISAVNDCMIALRAGTSNTNAAVLCAGSGLNCAVRAQNREIIYGYYIPDNLQGGRALGERAIQAVLDAHTGIGRATGLTPEILRHIRVTTVDALLQKKVNNAISFEEYLAIPRILERSVASGDAVAQDIFHTFAREISKYVLAGMEKLDILDKDVDVVLSGGIFKCKDPFLETSIATTLRQAAPRVRIINARFEPVIGAYLLNLDNIQVRDQETVYENLSKETHFKIHRR